jgi:hypothetical protein
VAGRQRVAERHDLERLPGVREGTRCTGQQRNATNRRTRDLEQTSPVPI